jgi:hypothetical protein
MRSTIIAAAGAAALFSTPALTQQPNQGSEALPNFSGVWGHPYVPAFEAPESGPVPVVNKSRRRQVFGVDGNPITPGVDAPVTSNTQQFVGDYTNPILKPQAADGDACRSLCEAAATKLKILLSVACETQWRRRINGHFSALTICCDFVDYHRGSRSFDLGRWRHA